MNTKLDDAFVWKCSLRFTFTQYESDHKSFSAKLFINNAKNISTYLYDTKTRAYLIQNVLLFHPQFPLLGKAIRC